MWVQSLGWEDPLEEGMVAIQYSCLENPMDRGACTVHRVAESRTRLKRLSTHTYHPKLSSVANAAEAEEAAYCSYTARKHS